MTKIEPYLLLITFYHKTQDDKNRF